MLQAYSECLATEGQRWTELLRQMKIWSVNDPNKFHTDIFINDMRAKATSTGVKSLSDLITSFSTWIEAEILERQASKSNKVISANATTPSRSGCAKHGPNAKHTTAECKGLMKRPQGQQGQRTNGKAPFNGRPKFNSDKVHFNQDKEAAGNRMHGKHPPFKKAYNAGYNGQGGSNGGHHGLKHQGGSNGGHNGPKHQGGSLEELLMGNYKGKHFDPTKSRKYTALAAYFQRSGQSATGALPSSSSNGANAHGASANAILPLQNLQGLPPSYHNFAFALTIEGRGAELNDMNPVQDLLNQTYVYSDEGHDIEMEEVEPQRVLPTEERHGDSGAVAGEAAPLRARQRPPAVRVTLKSVTATRAQWQRDLGWQQDLVQFAW
jgi:hypothetical protein